ncbi:MAG: DUF2029 domain-containing protein, partial [Chloroflexi bacterium]|nr:DUF2029 domain-containing protein [Chloroflexota bacterium]
VWVWYLVAGGNPADAATYYGIDMNDMYGGWQLGASDAYQYAPVFAQVTRPLRQLPFEVFVALIRGLSLIALVALAGPFTAVVLFLPPVAAEINAANINLLLAAAIAAGLRYPATWAAVVLTKVTPAVGLLWFVPQRRWRALGTALGTTAAVAGISFVIAPEQWLAWFDLLVSNRGTSTATFPYFLELWVRLPIAIGIALAAGLWGRWWPVAIASTIAAPVLYFPAQSIATGALPGLRQDAWTWLERSATPGAPRRGVTPPG